MSGGLLRDPLAKRGLRAGWRMAQLARMALATPVSGWGAAPRVSYGGARTGSVGGPLVKVKRLREHFPEHQWRYNLVYALSNAAYLPETALRLLAWRRIPLVHNQNGVFWPGWYQGDWRGQNAIMARAYHRADFVFWQSGFCRRSADWFLGERRGRGDVLFNAVDTTRFAPIAQGEAPLLAGGPFRLLLSGKINEHMTYRLTGAIDGVAHARRQGLEATLTVAGWVAPIAQAEAQELADSLGLARAVRFQGVYSQERAPAVYRDADAYINTTYKDACPNAVIEALSSGLPVAHSVSGGAPELVGAEAGVGLQVPDDWDRVHSPSGASIGEAILAIAANRDRMARAARKRALERFRIEDWIERHRAVFAELLEARS